MMACTIPYYVYELQLLARMQTGYIEQLVDEFGHASRPTFDFL